MGQQSSQRRYSVMLGSLLSLLPLFGYGISDYTSSRLSKGMHPVAIGLAFTVVNLPVVVIVCLLFGFPDFNLDIIMRFILASVVVNVALYSMLQAFKYGPVGVVAPIANAYAVVTLLLTVIFLNETVSILQIFSAIMVIVGIVLLSYNKDENNHKDIRKSLIYSIIAMILFGVGFVLFAAAAKQEWYQNSFLFEIASLLVTSIILVLWVRKDRINAVKEPFNSKFLYIGGLFSSIATLGLFGAIGVLGSVSVPASIAAGSPLITAVLARKYDKEKLNARQIAGALVVVLGIAALSIKIS